ncbi:Fc receptor-like protein 6 isoform X2 [Manis pentadactyla]|uniref:Fc receptor-like protein 6 isoform X2 n=1 Tax=Manis pentadactyla TaxID=143292 RepID=UPI00255CF330|nr:Fc receptor-like protein 6 isoform X2 [Manis pentadactyla]
MMLWVAVLLSAPCVGNRALLTLQARPHLVFEGDALTLRCQGRKHAVLSHVRFYKDGSYLPSSEERPSLTLGTATAASSGRYSCTAQVTYVLYVGTQTSETIMVQVRALFPPPVLSTIPFSGPRVGSPLTLRCRTQLLAQRPASSLLFSFYKGGQALTGWGPHPELYIPEVRAEHSGCYRCKAALRAGLFQKDSPLLEIRVWDPVSRPVLTLRPPHASLTVGHMVELRCEAKRGTPPILYTFYLDGRILGNRSAPRGGAISFLFPMMSEQDAGNYSCQAENSISKESSKPETLCLDGPQVPSAPPSSNRLAPWLSAVLLGVAVTAAALLRYFTPWRKNASRSPPSSLLSKGPQQIVPSHLLGPLPAQNLPPAPGEEQDALYVNVCYQNEKDEGIIYSEVCVVQNNNRAWPSESTSEAEVQSMSTIYQDPPRSL